MSFTINIDKFNFAEKPNPQKVSRDYAAEYAKFLTENAEKRLETKKADKASTLAGYGISDAYTKSETDNKIASLIDSAPDTLNTLNELADALGKDANFAVTVTEQIGKKIDKIDGFYLSSSATIHNTITGKDNPCIMFAESDSDDSITIPVRTSDLENDCKFISEQQFNITIGEIETALDSIIAIQNELIGGGTV